MKQPLVDAGVVAGAALIGIGSVHLQPGTHQGWVVVEVAAASILLLRRRAPVVTLWAMVAASLLPVLLGSPFPPSTEPQLWIPAATPIAVYSLMVYGRGAYRAWIPIGLELLISWRPWELSAQLIGLALGFMVAPALLGMYVAARRRLLLALTERAERAERDRNLYVAWVRARLAAEMHDVVTHRVSLMVLQSGALRMTSADPAIHAAADELRSTGTAALAELRDVIGLLRTGPSGADPMTEAVDIASLVAESTSIGLQASLVSKGNPSLASPAVRHTAYRIVREALTNVRKHAFGAQVFVEIGYRPAEVFVSVRNEAPDGETSPPTPRVLLGETGSGQGLSGLRERVAGVGGTFSAEATPDGGFQVTAILRPGVALEAA